MLIFDTPKLISHLAVECLSVHNAGSVTISSALSGRIRRASTRVPIPFASYTANDKLLISDPLPKFHPGDFFNVYKYFKMLEWKG